MVTSGRACIRPRAADTSVWTSTTSRFRGFGADQNRQVRSDSGYLLHRSEHVCKVEARLLVQGTEVQIEEIDRIAHHAMGWRISSDNRDASWPTKSQFPHPARRQSGQA